MIVCSLICNSVASGLGLDTRDAIVDASVSRMMLESKEIKGRNNSVKDSA